MPDASSPQNQLRPTAGPPPQPDSPQPEPQPPQSESAQPELESDELPPELLAKFREELASAGAPAEVVQLFEQPGSAQELLAGLQELVDIGLVPSPEQSLASLVEHFQPLLEPDIDPLQAELAGAELISTLRRTAPEADHLSASLQSLVTEAEEHGDRLALAMLRSLATVAPVPVRQDAAAAADRLVGGGLTDLPWAATLGAPTPEVAFGYADTLGAQEAVAVPFRYGANRHAMCVLIDHDLGGGVKDCWFTNEVDEVRAGYASMASSEPIEFAEYDPARAHAILAAALEQEPCPEQPDQVEDVDAYLDLLRQRVPLLAATSGTTAGLPD